MENKLNYFLVFMSGIAFSNLFWLFGSGEKFNNLLGIRSTNIIVIITIFSFVIPLIIVYWRDYTKEVNRV